MVPLAQRKKERKRKNRKEGKEKKERNEYGKDTCVGGIYELELLEVGGETRNEK